jgi:membrane carboxypeptidase/penicillin-binding protein PbpC
MGIRQDLHSLLEVQGKNGQILEKYSYVPGDRLLSRETTFLIQQILSDDGARSPVFGSASLLDIKGHPEVAVKTGTTNDLRDNWTIGYTPDYVVITWVGNNNNTRMSGLVSGTSGAAPVWNKVMTYLLADKPKRIPAIPSGVIGLNVCNLTGELPPDEGCDTHYEYFNYQYLPKLKLPLKNSLLINKDTGESVDPGSTLPNLEWQEHPSVKDLTSVWYCLDCPHPTDAPPRLIP